MATTPEPVGGLIGGAASLGSAASKALRKTYGIIANPEAWALYLVLFAGVLTIVKKNATPDIWEYSMWFGIALGVAALLYEMSGAKGFVRAWYHGQFGSMLWSGIIWMIAFGFSVNNWVGAASENQAEKTNVHKTAFHDSADARKTVIDLEKQLDLKRGVVDWSKALDAPESYEARIDAAKKDAAYEATRKGCKSKCIAKQQLAASLEADRQNAMNRSVVQEEIKVIAANLEKARNVAKNTKVEVSENRNDLLILTRYAGMSEEGAQIFNGLLSIIVVSILLSFGSMRAELDTLRAKYGPRPPSNILSRFKRAFTRLFLGREPKDVRVISTHTTTSDRAFAESIARKIQQMGAVPA